LFLYQSFPALYFFLFMLHISGLLAKQFFFFLHHHDVFKNFHLFMSCLLFCLMVRSSSAYRLIMCIICHGFQYEVVHWVGFLFIYLSLWLRGMRQSYGRRFVTGAPGQKVYDFWYRKFPPLLHSQRFVLASKLKEKEKN